MVCAPSIQIHLKNIVGVITSLHILTRNAERTDAVTLVKKLGALPLALDQAGSYVSAMQIPFSKYLLRFDGTFAEVTAKKPPSVVWQYRDDTVFTTWEVSFHALSPAAQELLLLLGFFDNQSIPEELLPLEKLNNEFKIGKLSWLFYLVRRSRLYPNSILYRLG